MLTLDTSRQAFHRLTDSFWRSKEKVEQSLADKKGKRDMAIKPDASRPRNSLEAQVGRMLTGIQFEKRIKSLTSNLIWEDSIAFPSRRLCYQPKPEIEEKKLLLFAFDRGFMPEFSVIDIPEDEAQEPKETARGWRTCLSRLIQTGLVTETQAFRVFGAPTHDSENWRNQAG